MNVWANAVITEKGLALLAKLTQGHTLDIVEAVTGAGWVTPGLLQKQTEVTDPKKRLTFRAVSYPETGACALPMVLSNEGVTAGYEATQVGAFATDPDEGKILFFIAQSVDSDNGTTIPSEAEMPGYSAEWTFKLQYGQADGVNVTVDPSNTVTRAELEEYVSNIQVDMIGGLAKVATTGDFEDLRNKPTSLPANGGNADTVDGKHASDFAAADHEHPVKESDMGITTAGTGAAYTATVAGITALKAGLSFMMIPHTISTSKTPTLNVNGLGAKSLRRRVSNNSTTTVASEIMDWLGANKPVRVTYDGLYWIVDLNRPNAEDMWGSVPIENGGHGGTTAAEARANLGAAAADHTHTASEVGAAAASHTHDADDLPVVPVRKGGTGATTAAAARSNLGAAAENHTHSAYENHVADKENPHDVTYAQVGAAAASHTHTASDLPTIPISKGGTGATTVAAARNALGLGNTSGAVPVANGGTGATTAEQARENLGIITLDEIPNLYVWKKYKITETAITTPNNAITSKKTSESNYADVKYADEITISDGVISLVNPTTISSPTVSTITAIKGKYAHSVEAEVVFWYGSDVSLDEEKNFYGVDYLESDSRTKIEASFVKFVASKTNDTYPTNGKHSDGYWYVYHKQLGE